MSTTVFTISYRHAVVIVALFETYICKWVPLQSLSTSMSVNFNGVFIKLEAKMKQMLKSDSPDERSFFLLITFICSMGPFTHAPHVFFVFGGGEEKCKVKMNGAAFQLEKRRLLKINQHLERRKKETTIIKTNSLSAVWIEIPPTLYPKPTGTGNWNNCCFSFFSLSQRKRNRRQQAQIAFVLLTLFFSSMLPSE